MFMNISSVKIFSWVQASFSEQLNTPQKPLKTLQVVIYALKNLLVKKNNITRAKPLKLFWYHYSYLWPTS